MQEAVQTCDALLLVGTSFPYIELAFPERPSVAFVRDGGFSMLMAEFAKYRLAVKVVVVNNDARGQIRWEQRVPSAIWSTAGNRT